MDFGTQMGLIQGLGQGLQSGIEQYQKGKEYQRQLAKDQFTQKMAQFQQKGLLQSKGYNQDQETGDLTLTPEQAKKDAFERRAKKFQARLGVQKEIDDLAAKGVQGTELSQMLSDVDKAYDEPADPGAANAAPEGLIRAPQTAPKPQGFSRIPGFQSPEEKFYAHQKEIERMKIEGEKRAETRKEESEIRNPSESRSNAALFGSRVQQAEKVFEGLEKEGFDRSKPGDIGVAGGLINAPLIGGAARMMANPKLLRQEQAERNFVNAVLRRESGAAISQGEFDSAEKQYFPRVGDPAPVLSQKKENRRLALAGLQAAAGPAFDKVQKQYGLISPDRDKQDTSFPKQIRNGAKTATVSNPQELAEAQKEGWN